MTADKKRPTPGGSRTPTGRPKKVAGRSEPDPVVEPVETPAPAPAPAPVPEPDPVPEPVETPTPGHQPRRGIIWVLVASIVVLALVGLGEIVYLARDPEAAVSATRPVATSDLSQRAAVEAAARSTEQILSTTYQDYDGQVAKATEKMTDTFAKEYRATADGLKEKYAAQQLKLQVKAVAQGVVQASADQVEALLFLNQYVEKVLDGEPTTAYAQYRALVTVVHTDHGWLVSNIETQ